MIDTLGDGRRPGAPGSAPSSSPETSAPGRLSIVVAVVTAGWCVGFATVNVVFEATDHFAIGRDSHLAGIRVMDWLVATLKVLGAIVALLSVTRRRIVAPAILATMLWGAFATLALYEIGSLAEGLAMALGVMDGADRVRLVDLGYLLFFGIAATGFGILAIGYWHRQRRPRLPLLLGLAGGPVLIGVVLGVIPAVLSGYGLLSFGGTR